MDVRSFFGRTVMLPAGLVERIDSTENKVSVDRIRDRIKDAPRYDDQALADHLEQLILGAHPPAYRMQVRFRQSLHRQRIRAGRFRSLG